MKTFPERVFLVVGDDDSTPEEANWNEIDTHELSWSAHREYKGDVGYVREDMVEKLIKEAQLGILREALLDVKDRHGTYEKAIERLERHTKAKQEIRDMANPTYKQGEKFWFYYIGDLVLGHRNKLVIRCQYFIAAVCTNTEVICTRGNTYLLKDTSKYDVDKRT